MKRIKDWKENIILIIVIIMAFFLPSIFNVAGLIKCIFQNIMIDFSNIQYYILMKLGNNAIGIVLAIIVLRRIRKHTKACDVNKGGLYHDHSYVGYWFCAKVLGYGKCSLLRVPIFMQFKLVIKDVFDEFDVGNDETYRIIEDEEIIVTMPDGVLTSTVNLILVDTYKIDNGMLPASTSRLSNIYISRNCDKNVRSYSKLFCEKVEEVVRKLPNNVTGINLFATTNPKHTKCIAENVFKLGGRCNITTLRVYPQLHNNGNWNFAEKGKKIY